MNNSRNYAIKNVPKSLRLASLAVAVAAALTIQPTLAQESNTPPTPPPHEWRMDQGDLAKHVEGKLDDLGAKLHLKDSQQAAWKQYRTQISEQFAARQKERGEQRDMQKNRDLSSPERLQQIAERLRAEADHLDKLAKQTSVFYKTLTPEQQTIFDLYSREMMGHMRGPSPMHGPGPGPKPDA
jgi:Spy/CpxP family protein refolding chaperone